ncbi:MAG: hypothetical protein WBL88_07735 [Nitrososphaeraceae archaeon]
MRENQHKDVMKTTRDIKISTYYHSYSELKLTYPGNRWKQMIAEDIKKVAMVT